MAGNAATYIGEDGKTYSADSPLGATYGYGEAYASVPDNAGEAAPQPAFELDPDDPDSMYLDPNAWNQFEEQFFAKHGNPFDADPDEEVKKLKAKNIPLLFRHVFGRDPKRGEKLSAEEMKSWNRALGQFEKQTRNEAKRNRSELMQRYTATAGMFQKKRSAYIAHRKRKETKFEKFKKDLKAETKERRTRIEKEIKRGAALSGTEEVEQKSLLKKIDKYDETILAYEEGEDFAVEKEVYLETKRKRAATIEELKIYDVRDREDELRGSLDKGEKPEEAPATNELPSGSGSGSVFRAKDKDGNMYASDSVDKVIRDLGDKGDINSLMYQKTAQDGSVGYAPLAPKLKANLAKIMNDESLPQEKRDEAGREYNKLFGSKVPEKKMIGAGGAFWKRRTEGKSRESNP